MNGINVVTGGESHGPLETCVVEGIPAGLAISPEYIDSELARRQRGHGRGGRMAIESDRCKVVGGVQMGFTIGSPIVVLVENRDHENWAKRMQVRAGGSSEASGKAESESVPRPGHADLVGMAKYHHSTIRPVLERASARETAARVVGGAVCKRLLEELGVTVRARVVQIGDVLSGKSALDYEDPDAVDWGAVESSPVACEDPKSSRGMCAAIDAARERGDSVGGVFEVWAWGLCPGLGSYVSMEQRLDGQLLGAMGSIPAIKGAEVGRAFRDAGLAGSQVHDPIDVAQDNGWRGVMRATNRAGGLEGGVTNGMPIVVRAAMKPIPTMVNALPSVDTETMRGAIAHVERSDVSAVPAAAVVGEAMVACVLGSAYVHKFASDSMLELTRSVQAYESDLEERGLWRRS